MSVPDVCYLSAVSLASAIKRKELSPVDVIDAVLDRIERVNPSINAYNTVVADQARAQAQEAERALMRNEKCGPLHGIPISVKDLIWTKGMRTTRGSRLFADFVPDESAPVVERVQAAGAIIVGKTTTSEFGWKGAGDSPLSGVTRNPWKLDRTSGASSAGAGAAVAAGLAPLAIGSDGAGSIRIPASFCGIFGLKPSVGRVPYYPASAVGMMSHVGPMTRTVRDGALLLDVLAGPDERDRFSLPAPSTSYSSALEGGIAGLRVAWSPDLGYAPVHSQVRQLATNGAKVFAQLGCALDEADPGFPDPIDFFNVIYQSRIGQMVTALPSGWREVIDPGLAALARRAEAFSAMDLAAALAQQEVLWDTARRFFQTYDLLLTPTVAIPAFELGIDGPSEVSGQPVKHLGWTPFTFPFNLTGQPAATVPCGWTTDGLPVGLQIVGRRYDDVTVLKAAASFEEVAPWSHRRPNWT